MVRLDRHFYGPTTIWGAGGGVCTFGAPLILYGESVDQLYLDLEKRLSPYQDLPSFGLHNFVNNGDLVPRLLGDSLLRNWMAKVLEVLIPVFKVRSLPNSTGILDLSTLRIERTFPLTEKRINDEACCLTVTSQPDRATPFLQPLLEQLLLDVLSWLAFLAWTRYQTLRSSLHSCLLLSGLYFGQDVAEVAKNYRVFGEYHLIRGRRLYDPLIPGNSYMATKCTPVSLDNPDSSEPPYWLRSALSSLEGLQNDGDKNVVATSDRSLAQSSVPPHECCLGGCPDDDTLALATVLTSGFLGSAEYAKLVEDELDLACLTIGDWLTSKGW